MSFSRILFVSLAALLLICPVFAQEHPGHATHDGESAHGTAPTTSSTHPVEATTSSTDAASATTASAAGDWCSAHEVPESKCTRCNKELIPAFKAAGDWCAAHDLPESQCRTCNPKLENKPPSATK